MENKAPIERVFEILGGPSAVAKHFSDEKTGKPLTHWAVCKWRNKVPADRVLRLEQLTAGRVTRYELREDIYGKPPDQRAA